MVSLSKGSGKMEGICSVNTSPLKNPFCNKMNKNKNIICNKCYSRRMLKTSRKNCNGAFERNHILGKRLLTRGELPVVNARVCRLHSHGELLNETHWKNFTRLAHYNPGTLFVLWTKRLNLLGRKPANLQVIYSNPVEDSPVVKIPKGCIGVYNIVSEDYAKAYNLHYNCGTKCLTCKKCYTKGRVGIIYAPPKNGKNGTKTKG